MTENSNIENAKYADKIVHHTCSMLHRWLEMDSDALKLSATQLLVLQADLRETSDNCPFTFFQLGQLQACFEMAQANIMRARFLISNLYPDVLTKKKE